MDGQNCLKWEFLFLGLVSELSTDSSIPLLGAIKTLE